MNKVLGVIETKFKYNGGPVKYWDREYYTHTIQGSKNCDYSLKYEDGKDL